MPSTEATGHVLPGAPVADWWRLEPSPLGDLPRGAGWLAEAELGCYNAVVEPFEYDC